MSTLLKDVIYAVRGLRRSPAFALLAIVTLALGIGANTAIFSVVHGAILKPLPYPQPDQLVFITSQFPGLGFNQFWVSAPEFVEFRKHNQAFRSVGAYRVRAANVGAERPVRPVTAIVSEDLLPTLGIAPVRGRAFTRADTLPGAEDVAVLSYGLWQGAFGGAENAVGQIVLIDGVKTRIVGVMPAGADVHDEKVELWLPLTLDPVNPGGRASHFLYMIGRLKDGMSLTQARTDLDRLLRQWPKESGSIAHVPNATSHRLRFDPLKEDIVGNVKTAAWVLQGAVAFVLLIACANLASLLLARAESRTREFALRASLGASTWRLLRQFATEGLVLSAAGAAAGVAIAVFGLKALLATNPDGIPRAAEITVDGTVLAFTLVVTVVCGLVFGLMPLLRVSHGHLHDRLKEGASRLTGGRTHRRGRNALVVAEVALAVVLVVGAVLMVRTFWNLMKVDAGFDRSRMVTFQIVLPSSVYKPAETPRFFNTLVDRLKQVPGVQSAAAMSGLPPLRDVNANDTDFEDITPGESGDNRGPAENVDYWQGVSADYVTTLGIPVVEGRGFERSDASASAGLVVLVNEALAHKFFPGRSPIGRRLRPQSSREAPWFTIAGVLKDVKQRGMGEQAGTELYLLNDQLPPFQFAYADMNLVLRTVLPPETLAPTIQQVVRSMDASLPVVKLRTMDDVFLESVSRPRFLAILLGIFAALALVLAGVGIYGVLSYLVAERQQEIGVRMALGAERSAVLGMILRQGLTPTGVGLVLGIGGALALTRFLQAMLFGVQPADPMALAAGVLFIAAVGLAACLVPARRATRVDPMVVLRAE
jgi:putative ABC transport system permease protein